MYIPFIFQVKSIDTTRKGSICSRVVSGVLYVALLYFLAIKMSFFGLAYQGKDVVFRFIIEYNNMEQIKNQIFFVLLKGFWPLFNNGYIFIGGFLKDDMLACVET
jgi:hypothetical protein